MDKIQEKQLKGINGWIMVAVVLILLIGGTVAMCVGFALVGGDDIPENPIFFVLAGAGCVILIAGGIMINGFKVIAPNEAAVLTLFGKYHGTLKNDGFYFVNPFCKTVNPASPFEKLGKKISLKAMTLNNDKQKVNDEEGNPIEISVVVIWRIKDTAKAVFAVDNYMTFISTQCDSAIRQVARQYP